jgi:hypothetical protein
MDIELLINKYIDGELTQSEDEQLRKQLASDPEFKSKFDASVETQYLLAKDADSVIVPEKLVKNTEEVVLAKIMGKSAELEEDRRKVIPFYLRWAGYSAAAGLAIFALIFNLGSQDDNQTDFSDNTARNYITVDDYQAYDTPLLIEKDLDIPFQQSVSVFSNQAIEVKSTNSNDIELNGQSNSGGNTIGSRVATGISSDALANDNVEKTETVSSTISDDPEIEKTFTIVENPLNYENSSILGDKNNEESLEEEVLSGTVYPEYENTNGLSSQFRSGVNQLADKKTVYDQNTTTEQAYINAVQKRNWVVNTNLTNDIGAFSTNENDEFISNYSISAGYRVSNNSLLGMEIGNSNLLINTVETRIINTDPNDPTSNQITVPVNVPHNLNQLWGSVFYEYNFNIIEKLDFSPRIGLGMGQAGAVGFGRVMLRYDLFNGIGLRAGAEYRGMGFHREGFTSPIPFYGSTSFIYGIDYSF